MKHPLQNKWAWWFYKNDKAKTWEANLRLVTTFDTVSFFEKYTAQYLVVCVKISCDKSNYKRLVLYIADIQKEDLTFM